MQEAFQNISYSSFAAFFVSLTINSQLTLNPRLLNCSSKLKDDVHELMDIVFWFEFIIINAIH